VPRRAPHRAAAEAVEEGLGLIGVRLGRIERGHSVVDLVRRNGLATPAAGRAAEELLDAEVDARREEAETLCGSVGLDAVRVMDRGSQHLVASRLLASGGLDPNKDVSTVVIGGAPALLQALLAGSIQTTALSPPTIIVARDKFKVNILAEPPKDFLSTQGGFAVTDRALVEKRDLLRRMLRARTKAYRYFHENEKGTAETLAKYTRLDLATTTETYRMSKFGFTTNSVLTDKEIEILLRDDAKTLGLAQPVSTTKVFDFGPQREVNKELGIK